MVGSLSRAMSALNSLLLCLILFFEQIIGAPSYDAVVHNRMFGDFHLPDPNAAIFEVGFYRVVLPVIVQILLVAIPALWGFRVAVNLGKLRRFVSTVIWAAAIATLALLLLPELGLWFFLSTRIFHINAPSKIWSGIQALRYLRPLEFWPIVFLIAHTFTQHRLKTAPA